MLPCTIVIDVNFYSFQMATNSTNSQMHFEVANRRIEEIEQQFYFTASWMRSQLVSHKSSSLRVITTFKSNNNAQLSPEECFFSFQFIAICFGSSTFRQLSNVKYPKNAIWKHEYRNAYYKQLNHTKFQNVFDVFLFSFWGTTKSGVFFGCVRWPIHWHWRRRTTNSLG